MISANWFRHPNGALRLLQSFCILLAATFLTVSSGYAQQTVQAIEVQYAGPANISKEKILANMRTTVGQPYSPMFVEEDIRSLYGTGEVSNVRIFSEPSRGGVKVVVVVQSKPIIREIVVEGSERIKAKRLRKEISLKPGQPLSEDVLEADRQKIVEYYNKRGYADIDVQYKVNTDESTGNATVLYSVFEGDRSNVKGIDFEGNEHVKSSVLRKLMETKVRTIFNLWFSKGRLKDKELQADIEKIKEYYQNLGYIDVEIVDVRVDRINSNNVRLTFVINEGTQYFVGKFTISGNQVFSEEDIRTRIKTKAGGVYSPGALRDDLKVINDMYGERGYVDLQLVPEGTPGGPALVNLHLQITEGGPSTIDHINIEGNTRTKDKVIRRELAVAPGELYDTVAIEASKARLKNLDYFSQVDAVPSATGVAGQKDLNVIVQEKRTGALNFGAGFSTVDSIVGFIELQQTNFDITNWSTFTGAGQKFRVRLDYGAERKDFVMSLTEPWFLDYQLAVGSNIYFREQNYVSTEYNQRYYGFDIFARKPLGEFASVELQYSLQNITIYDIAGDASQQIKDEEGTQLKSQVTLGLNHDTRDSAFLTRRGHLVEFNTYVAGGPLGGETEIYGLGLEGSQYFALPYDLIILVQAEMATVSPWNGSKRVPLFDRLFLGGAYDLRGFDFRDVGPKDVNGDPIGGNSLGRFTTELTFPIIERVRGAIFYDAGFVNRKAWNFSFKNYNSDYGIGLRMNLPVGPIRLDYGIPLEADADNDSSGRFNFSVGYQF